MSAIPPQLSDAEIDVIRRCLQQPLPPGYRNPGPRVAHLVAPRQAPVGELLTEALGLPPDVSAGLLALGAVYSCPVPPSIPSYAVGTHDSSARQAALAVHGRDTRLSVPRRAGPDTAVSPGSYIRAHLHPKRFPAAGAGDWAARVLEVTAGYVIVDKPAGVPVPITVDNSLECVLTRASEAVHSLGLARESGAGGGREPAQGAGPPPAPQPAGLCIIHRLDVCTEGVLALGRSLDAVREFQAAQRAGTVTKTYRALCQPLDESVAAPVPGVLVHYLQVGTRVPGLPLHTVALDEPADGASLSQLEILDVVPLPGRWRDSSPEPGTEPVARRGTPDPGTPPPAFEAAAQPRQPLYECTIRLITGRTHQIRAQFAAVGLPLVGDTMYQALARKAGQAPIPAAEAGPIAEPEGAIGLQAARLELRTPGRNGAPGVMMFACQAPTPWWADRRVDARE